ncbi:MAG: sugar ABC transporter permease [Anaerolineales bacterium]|nr:sugar ABC transporter permease [Anaerolineales bacterium]
MLSPYLVGTLLLVALPASVTLYLAFHQYDALSKPVWFGTTNFISMFRDDVFVISLRNSAMFALLSVPLRVLGALLLALLLSQRRRGVGFYRVAVYLPTIIPDVAYALIWLWIFNPVYGPLNKALAVFGIDGPAWLVNRETALLAIVIMFLFQIGEGFIVLLASLQGVPHDYYEAAQVDGASAWQRFRLITFPLIRPWLVLLMLRDIILSTQSTFTPAFIMTGGDPYYATMFLPLVIYEEAYDRFRFGLASAMMVFMFLVLTGLLMMVYLVVRGWGYDDEQ